MATEGAVADKAVDAGAAAAGAGAAAGAAKTDAGAAASGAAGGEKKPDAAGAGAAAGEKKVEGAAADAGAAKKDEPAVKTSILGAAASKEVKTETKTQEGAPEKYADFKLPDGIALDAKVVDSFKAVAKEAGLSQDAAQKLVTFQAQNLKAELEGRINAVAQQSEVWAKEARAQFGAAWEREFANAAKGIESFGTPKMREILTAVGLDNHPEFVAMFARVGAKMSEGQPVDGRTAGSERVPTEKLMFDKMEPKK